MRLENIFHTAEFCQEMPFTKPKMFCSTFLSLSEIHTYCRSNSWQAVGEPSTSTLCNARERAKHALAHSLR